MRAWGALVALAAFVVCAGDLCAQEKKRVLLLHSYHHGLAWTDSITDGLRSVLSRDIDLSIEYLDGKRFYSPAYLARFGEFFAAKYSASAFNVVITSDNMAMDFFLPLRARIMPSIPVVFCGINNFHHPSISGLGEVTGVIEEADFCSTLDLALKLHPGASRICVINDRSTTGRALHSQLVQILPRYGKRAVFEFLHDRSVSEIERRVSSLGEDSIILMLVLTRSSADVYYPYHESLRIVYKDTRVPIYSLWEFYLNHGIVGGKLQSGELQGRIAGRMARAIATSAARASALPVVAGGTSRFIFDYRELRRHGINQSLLPSGSIILNRPVSFIQKHLPYIAAMLSLAAAFFAAALIIQFNVSRRRRAEIEQLESEERYRSLVENVNIGIFRYSGSLKEYIFANKAMARLHLYRDIDEFLSVPAPELYRNFDEFDRLITDIVQSGRVSNREICIFRQGGSYFWALCTAYVSFDDTRKIACIEGILEDITVKKESEDALRDSRDKLEMMVAKRTSKLIRTNEMLLSEINERKKIESALRESEERFRTLANTTTAAIFIIRNLRIVYFNNAFEVLTGYREGEVSRLELSGVIHEDFHPIIRAITLPERDDLLKKSNNEIRIVAKDGTEKWINVSIGDIQYGGEISIIGTAFDVTERRETESLLLKANKELEKLAQYDFLTNLLNRRFFISLLEQELSKVLRYNMPLTIMMIDLDYFKAINDTYGHISGDTVLAETASVIKRSIRDIDIAGRYGGEEFSVILTHTESSEAISVARRVCRNVEKNRVILADGSDIAITCSIGLAQFSSEMEGIDFLINCADLALYKSKSEGRNRVTLY